jgi:hypothetical protein
MFSNKMTLLLTLLGLLLVANALMLYGYTNYPESFKNEGFTNYLLGGAPSGSGYQPIGIYDNVVKTSADRSKVDAWRGNAYSNEPLLGKEPNLDNGELFLFANNQCKPECCGASFSCGSGCVCTTEKQRHLLNTRGGNSDGGSF